jgi:hypothetical protein
MTEDDEKLVVLAAKIITTSVWIFGVGFAALAIILIARSCSE